MPAPPTRFQGGVLFDDAFKSAFRIGDERGRSHAATASDILQSTLVAYPFVIDAGLFGFAIHGNADTAWQMMMIDAESQLLTGALMTIVKSVTGRARPYTESCGNDTCGTGDRNKSFFSGHAASSFTGAGLICAHHANLPLYGNQTADQASCAAALVLAGTTGLLRVAADQHYATDVVAGALVGLLSGYLLPELVFYRGWMSSQPRQRNAGDLAVIALPELRQGGVGIRIALQW